jgi:hypothetical protein
MQGSTVSVTTAAGVLLTTFLSLHNEIDVSVPLPVVVLNGDGGVLSDRDLCTIYKFDRIFSSDYCSAFVTARTSTSIFSLAETRAMACAVHSATECIISAEIGFAVPVAYISDVSGGLQSIIAPKILTAENPTSLRILNPIDELNIRHTIFNTSIFIEFMTIEKRVVRKTIVGDDAFCVQLLLRVFDDACIAQL